MTTARVIACHPPTMAVIVDTRIVPIGAAHRRLPRIDTVLQQPDGQATVIAGTPDRHPVPPTACGTVVAYVDVPAAVPFIHPGLIAAPTPTNPEGPKMIPTRFYARSNPDITVEAVQLADTDDCDQLAAWCGGDVEPDPGGSDYFTLHLNGDVGVEGDWVVRQPDGFHMWTDEGFRSTYAEDPR